jgi:hypothetical protein
MITIVPEAMKVKGCGRLRLFDPFTKAVLRFEKSLVTLIDGHAPNLAIAS